MKLNHLNKLVMYKVEKGIFCRKLRLWLSYDSMYWDMIGLAIETQKLGTKATKANREHNFESMRQNPMGGGTKVQMYVYWLVVFVSYISLQIEVNKDKNSFTNDLESKIPTSSHHHCMLIKMMLFFKVVYFLADND